MPKPKKPKRDPGPAIKALLRREVNFGCPVRFQDGTGCGSPVLTFHHFDPPWSVCNAHDPHGMIALCPEHHNQADGGLWTVNQLRQMKHHPFVDSQLHVRWPWQTEAMVIKVGRSLVLNGGSALRFDGVPAVRFDRATIPGLGMGIASLTSQVRDVNRNRWLHVEDGWFDLRLEKTVDVVFAPQTKTFSAVHDDSTSLSLQFKHPRVEEFEAEIPEFWSGTSSAKEVINSIEKSGAVDSDGRIPLVEFEGTFTTDKLKVHVKKNTMHFEMVRGPGAGEAFDWQSHIVDGERRMVLHMGKGPEFFSLG